MGNILKIIVLSFIPLLLPAQTGDFPIYFMRNHRNLNGDTPINTSGFNIYAQIIGDTLRVATNFNSTKDLWLDFRPLPPNYLYNLINISFHNDTHSYADNDLTGQRTVWKTNTTDVIGPYYTNYNGTGNFFVGGAHGHLTYNLLNGDDLPTAEPVSVGITGTNSEGLYYSNDSLILNWSNDIFNYTTIQNTGVVNGTPETRENITAIIYPSGQVTIQNQIAVDSADIITYYGQQWSNASNKYQDSIYFIRGAVKDWEAFANAESGTSTTAPNYLGWANVAKDQSHRIYASIDYSYGLGTASDINYATYDKAFTTTSKTYSNLIRYTTTENGNGFVNETLNWRGFYKFYANDNKFTYREKGKNKFIAYFVAGVSDTLNYGTAEQMLKIHSKDSTIKLNNAYPYVVTPSEGGAIDAEIINKQLPFTSSNLVASYDFNYGITLNNGVTGVVDQSGNGNNLVNAGSPKVVDMGENAGFFFDGTDDDLRITRAQTDDFGFNEQSFTVEFDIKGTEIQLAGLVRYYRTSSSAYWAFSQASGTGYVTFNVRDAAGNQASCDFNAFNFFDDEWHHVATVFNETTDSIYCYADGVLRKQVSCATIGDISQTNTATTFGLNNGLVDTYRLRHCNIFREALSGTQIVELYNYYFE